MLSRQRGYSLIELAIGIGIVGILMAAAIPQFTQALQNGQMKTATENMVTGINLARAEALRRNMPVSFYLVSDLTNACALSSTGNNWVVALANPAGLCAVAPVDSTDATAPTAADPKIVQKFSGLQSGANARVFAFLADGATTSNSATFNGLGRITGATSIAWLDFKNSTGACESDVPAGPMRCMRILISTGGQARVCDPKVSAVTDPRKCP
ncbi:MAG: GspH/FimT family pseudopilin [Betaproteobacteria bacterium]